jgi:hypothetical protein
MMKAPLVLSLVLIAGPIAFPADPSGLPAGSTGKEAKPVLLTAEGQKALLAKRAPGGMAGSFNSYASLLYAMDGAILHTDDEEIGKASLSSPFPEFYKPTRAEFFNAIARQTSSSWSYDEKRAFWVFAKPALPMPFKITLAKDWESAERGNYLFCKPPTAPIGMDIYVMAEYSSTPVDPALPAKMREACAMMFATNFKKDVTAKDMSLAKVGTYEALHFKSPTPRPGTTWRQWAIAENGRAFVIVSAMDDANEKEVLPGVEEALQTFEVTR